MTETSSEIVAELRKGMIVLRSIDNAHLAAWVADHAGQVFRLHGKRGASLHALGAEAEARREPLNITSRSPEPLRLVSNFAHTPFELEGLAYASIEGFWQGLKFPDEADRRRLAAMHGSAAKDAGYYAPAADTLMFEGRTIRIGTWDHWQLMKRACVAKFSQHEAARAALLSTGHRPLVHQTRPDSRTIPGVIMAEIWTQLRQRLQKASATKPKDASAMADWTIPNDPLGAFCRDNHIAVKGSGAGPLAGLTFAAKDAFNIAGARTGMGQPDWLRDHEPEIATAGAVQRLLAAGADMVAKAHCDELCYSLTGENVHYGTPLNVNAPGRVPGGSSNGSAAAVAGGLVDFALGTDCGGSVRIPASYCGIIGLRPTHGRVSAAGVQPFGPSFDVVGWFARDIALFGRVGDALLGVDAAGAPARLIIADDAWEQVERPVAAALRPAAARAGAILGMPTHLRVSPEGLLDWSEVFRTLQAAEIWATLGAWVMATKPDFGPGIKERFEYAATITPAQVDAAKARRRAITAHLDGLLGRDGVICLPTSPRAAPLRGTPVDTVEVEYRNQALRILCIAGLAGLPQISLPLATIDGLPLGLSLIGPRNSDQGLIALARGILGS